jgi:hypothetical protein
VLSDRRIISNCLRLLYIQTYFISCSLERNYKYELLTEHDLGVTIDLILPETYELDMVDGMERLDPADEKLLEEELNPAQEKRRNMKHSQVSIQQKTVFRIRIRIRRIRMFLGLPDPDPSITKQR